MSKYLLLECNRLRGKSSYNNLDEESDKFKNSWVNLVSNTGIIVNAGDTISLEQVILNSKGASDEVIEFLGEENEEGFVDNQCNLEYSFYINHCGQNTARMPFIYHKTYRGQGTIQNPNRIGTGDSADWEYTNGLIQAGNDVNLKTMLSRRSLGETFFPLATSSVAGADRNWSKDYFYIDMNDYYMGGSMLLRMKTLQTGGGSLDAHGDPVAGSGYVAGRIYNTRYFGGDSGQGVGLQIRVESITTSGNVGGIVQSWSVFDIGYNYDKILNTPRLELFEDTGGDAVVGTTHILQMFAYPQNETYSQADGRGFDGTRFSFLNQGYSGLASEEEGSTIQNPNTTDTGSIIQFADKRKKKINLNISEGFLTPDNVGAILTDQLHEPTLINKTSNNKADFLDYSTLEYFHRDAIGGFSEEAKPVIVSTPTYQPQTCNMYMEGIPNTRATLIGSRRGFYHHLAYKNADRFCGLKNAFWNFAYFGNDFDTDNDIVTGTMDSNTIGNTLGDFGNIDTGDLGCRVCLLNDFPEDGDTMTASFNKNGLFLTNMKWNSSNIQRLKDGFRKAEYYLGDLSKPIDTNSNDYKYNLAVNLDLGMYDDEESTQYPLMSDNSTPSGFITSARTQFASYKQGIRASVNLTEFPVDYNYYTTSSASCKASQTRNFPEDIENDTQQLGSVWVRSRWQDGFTYDNTKDASYTNTKLDLGFLTDNAGKEFDTSLTADIQEKDFFIGSWIDTFGNIQTTEKAIQEAIDSDLAIVPVFTRHYTTGKFCIDSDILAKEHQTPYIAFVNAIRLGSQENHPDFDKVNLANDENRWSVDYWNIGFGTQLGLDHSFTRNEAVCLVSPMIGNEPPLILKNYMNVAYIGAVNPSISFNPQLSRFEIGGLNTPQNVGNGLMSSIPELLDANPNPEQTCFKIMRKEQICNFWNKLQGDIPIDPSTQNPISQQDVKIISQFDDAQQEEGSIMDSQSGIAIEGIYLLDKNGNETQITNGDFSKYKGTLFDKMGFQINQLLPEFGSENAFFTNQFTFQQTKPTYATGLINMTKPATTGAYISSAEIQTTSLNELNMPLYDLGVNTATREATPDITEGTITAFKLADKLSFPYFCIYSSIPSAGTDTTWTGGEDGHSKLPCMGYLTRENNIGDFYYNSEQSFQYTATKDFTLTEIETDIRLPDGSRPRFEGHSAVIYKITKPLNSLPQPPPISSKKKSK